MRESVQQTDLLMKGQKEQIGIQKAQINQILTENDLLKQWNQDLETKLEENYKKQIDKRKSSIGVKKSMDQLCENVEQIQVS